MRYKFILILIVPTSFLVLGYNLVVHLCIEDQNPTYGTVPEGPQIFNEKAEKLKIKGLLRLTANNDLSYISGSIENDHYYYNVVVDLSLLGKTGIKLNNSLYEKYHIVKISNQYKHFMVPKDFEIYEIVEVLEK